MDFELPAEDLKTLRVVAVLALQANRAVGSALVNSRLHADSALSLQRLDGWGLVNRIPEGGSWLPTAIGLSLLPDLASDVTLIANAVVTLGRTLLGIGDESRHRVTLDELARELERTIPLEFSLPSFRFLLGLSVRGLEPYISPIGIEPGGMPQHVYFGSSLWSISTYTDIVEAWKKKRAEDSVVSPIGTWPPPPTEPEAPKNGLEDLLTALRSEYQQDATLAGVLSRDATEVELCRKVGAYKAVLVLCGSILEGVLVDLLQQRVDLVEPLFRKRTKRSHAKFPADASLPDLLALATDRLHASVEPLLGAAHKAQAETVMNHRDLIHPHREVRGGEHRIDADTAGLLYYLVRRVLGDVASAIREGWLQRYRDAS